MGGGEEELTRGDPLPKARRWGAVCGSRMGLSPMGLCWEQRVWGALGGGRLHPAFWGKSFPRPQFPGGSDNS